MPLIRIKFITRDFMREHPNWFFLFGDNECRVGRGGQAKEMRGEPNAIGIRTKRAPGIEPLAYWSDDEFRENIKMVADDFLLVLRRIIDDPSITVVVPSDGLGTGMSELQRRAPKTLIFIETMILSLDNAFTLRNGLADLLDFQPPAPSTEPT